MANNENGVADDNREPYAGVKNLTESAKNIFLCLAAAGAGVWALFHFYATEEASRAAHQLTEFKIAAQQRQDVPHLEIAFDVQELSQGSHQDGGRHPIQINVKVRNTGQRNAVFVFEDYPLLTVSRASIAGDKANFEAHHELRPIKLVNGQQKNWNACSIPPNSEQTLPFLYLAEAGVHYIEFKAKMSPADAQREDKKFSDAKVNFAAGKRSNYWASGMYYYVEGKATASAIGDSDSE